MQASFFTKLRAGTSPDRLDVYRSADDSNFDVIGKYLWNMALSQALYPALQTIEVALRNTIHQAAIGRFHKENWFIPPTSELVPPDRDVVASAARELRNQGKATTANSLVAELSFGFWVTLLNSRYERIFWQRMLLPAFPNMPRTIRTRHALSKRFNEIRTLRNRVFHHERIIHLANLPQQHQDILEALSWINPEWQQVLAVTDQFQEVYRCGLEDVRCKLDQMMNFPEYEI